MSQLEFDDFNEDKVWSDQFIPEIQHELGQVFFRVAPMDEDMKRNTDLMVFSASGMRISARMRKYEYFVNYPNDFTVRSTRCSGAKTEIDKIMWGWGDYFFYGFADESNSSLHAYGIGNLKVFRQVMWDYFRKHKKFPDEERFVKKSECYFVPFKWEMFPREMLIASKNLNIKFDDTKIII